MFGIWRFLLALEVVAYHLLNVPDIGQYAVFAFFVLSGFLMTAIMQKSYGYERAGVARFALNRALRLLPTYWFAVALSLILIAVLGASPMAAFNTRIRLPVDFVSWAENLTMIFVNWHPKDERVRLVPPAWALTVEIVFYAMIALGASRSRAITALWVVISVVYVIVSIMAGGDASRLYAAIGAGSLPFALGAMLYHYRAECKALLDRLPFTSPLPLIASRWLCWAAFSSANALLHKGWLVTMGQYLNIGLSLAIVCRLYDAGDHATPSQRRIDSGFGDLSYPIYLLHWQAAAIATVALSGGLIPLSGWRMAAMAGAGLVIAIALGLLSTRAIDAPIARWRAAIRPARS